ncbi:MAG: hypothetical protein ACRDOO_21645 [Actinomadura sp.]
MFAEEAFDVARARPARPFVRAFSVLLLLLGLVFMHGACAGAVAHNASGGHGDVAAAVALVVADSPHDGHRPGHDPCCDLAAGHDCLALLVASLLLLLTLGLAGSAIRSGICDVYRGLRQARRGLRAGPSGGMPRLALCVIRI